jgi:hypothetical protein
MAGLFYFLLEKIIVLTFNNPFIPGLDPEWSNVLVNCEFPTEKPLKNVVLK